MKQYALSALLLGLMSCSSMSALPNNQIQNSGAISSWDEVKGYFIQDVCTDVNGKVLMGVSPLDGNAKCPKSRDLKPGENLPWHKTSNRIVLDEFPAATPSGMIEIKIKAPTDGVLHLGDGPANIYLQSPNTLSAYMGLSTGGPTYHINSSCVGGVPKLPSLYDTRVRVDKTALVTDTGLGSTYGIGFSDVYTPSPVCPNYHLHGLSSAWHFASYSYPLPHGQTTPPIKTLVSNEDETDAGSDTDRHSEVYYQTQCCGRLRFESYQNLAGLDATLRQTFQDQHDKLVASKSCPVQLSPPPTTVGGEWLETNCTMYNQTNPPLDMVRGDSPQQWVDIAKASNMGSVVFGVAATDNPHIDSVSPTTIPWNYNLPITIKGTGFVNKWFGTDNIVNFNGGPIFFPVNSTGSGTKIVFTIDPASWAGSRKGNTLKCKNNFVHVYDGVSISNEVPMTIQNCPL